MSEFKVDDDAEQSASLPWWRVALRSGENSLVIFVLSAMVIVPLAEITLRKILGSGIAGFRHRVCEHRERRQDILLVAVSRYVLPCSSNQRHDIFSLAAKARIREPQSSCCQNMRP